MVAGGKPPHKETLVSGLIVGDFHVLRIPDQLPAWMQKSDITEHYYF
jgi:hypothetical protein